MTADDRAFLSQITNNYFQSAKFEADAPFLDVAEAWLTKFEKAAKSFQEVLEVDPASKAARAFQKAFEHESRSAEEMQRSIDFAQNELTNHITHHSLPSCREFETL